MNAGAYRERIVIERNQFVEDEIGNQEAVWKELYAGYAYMNNLSGSEYWAAAQTQSQNTVMFILRFHPILSFTDTKRHRILHKGAEYNIVSIDNVQYKNETVKIRAVRKE